jgi:hypothetical protein
MSASSLDRRIAETYLTSIPQRFGDDVPAELASALRRNYVQSFSKCEDVVGIVE